MDLKKMCNDVTMVLCTMTLTNVESNLVDKNPVIEFITTAKLNTRYVARFAAGENIMLGCRWRGTLPLRAFEDK